MKKRIFVCGIAQETNVFNPIVSKINMFGCYNCQQVIHTMGMLGGMLTTLTNADTEMTYGTSLGASSGGPIDDAVWQGFLSETLQTIKEKGPFDGIAISMHGATSSPTTPDVCGEITAAIRLAVGDDVPIAISHDLHANVTRKTAMSVNYICGYQEYPHIDTYQTGVRAAKLLLGHLDGNPLKTAYATVPMIAPAHAYTTKKGALLALVTDAKAMVERGEIADYSIFEAQPWLDAPEFTSAVVVTAKDEKTAVDVANLLVKRHFDTRYELQGEPLFSIEEIVEKALSNKTGKPIVLVDSADSRGAGSTADSAAVLEKLLPYRDQLVAAVGVQDAAAVDKAFSLGVGAVADFTVGATKAPSLSSPVLVTEARVRSLHLGNFISVGPISRGERINCGRTAVLEVGKILVQISERGGNEKDIGFYRSFGIDPEFCQLVSVKACTSLRAGYTPIAAEICNTDTPGAAGTVLQKLPYKQRQVPLFPFEEITEDDIVKAVCYR